MGKVSFWITVSEGLVLVALCVVFDVVLVLPGLLCEEETDELADFFGFAFFLIFSGGRCPDVPSTVFPAPSSSTSLP